MSTYYIASLKHTSRQHEHITFWGRFDRGYTPVVGSGIGRYCYGEAISLNDGMDCLAVPCSFVDALVSPEPYWKPAARFYDQRGPVVDNTRAIWDLLIGNSLKNGRRAPKVKPEVFRGRRRSFAWKPAEMTI